VSKNFGNFIFRNWTRFSLVSTGLFEEILAKSPKIFRFSAHPPCGLFISAERKRKKGKT